MSNATITPRIYVASLSDYNNGNLHGVWIDCADKDADDIRAEVDAMLNQSKYGPAEEWAIHDYEFGGIRLGEWESFEAIAELAECLQEYGEAFAAWADYLGTDNLPDNPKQAFADQYQGECESKADYAEDFYRETGGEIPKDLQFYIDWESMARDWEINGDVTFLDSETGYYVFNLNA